MNARSNDLVADASVERVMAGVEYDGAAFAGWQRQNHARSVQQDVETALSKVADRPVGVICAGRTDAGVHSRGQVIHFDTTAKRSERSWLLGTNTHLADDVVLRWVRFAAADFHARFSAGARHYRYRILNRDTRPALHRDTLTAIRNSLNVELMQAGAGFLLGRHDFSAFRAAECQAKSPVRTVHDIRVRRHGSLVEIDVVANAFLHRMVRNIAGVLIAIGSGEHGPDWARAVLDSRDRRAGGVTAPAGGLEFMGVHYPERFGVPLAAESRAVFDALATRVNL